MHYWTGNQGMSSIQGHRNCWYRIFHREAKMFSWLFHSIIGSSYTLTHWGRVTHICVGKLIIIGSDNGLSPGRRQAIIRTNAGILLIGPLRTNFSEILIEIRTFSFKKMRLKVSSAKWRTFCLGLNVLITRCYVKIRHKVANPYDTSMFRWVNPYSRKVVLHLASY